MRKAGGSRVATPSLAKASVAKAPARSRVCKRCNKPIPASAPPQQKLCGRSCQKGYSHKGRYTVRDKNTSLVRQRREYTPAFERPFRAWDGEGEADKLTLLANSDGGAIHARESGLGTEDCLDFLLRAGNENTNVWFAFGYDVNMILRDLPRRQLQELSQDCETYWHGYRLSYFPRKKFQVSAGGRSYTSYDAWGFFQSSFIHALEDWSVPIPQIIHAGKRSRGDFRRWRFADIVQYNARECELLVVLMDKLRRAIEAAGWRVHAWHGAGALSGWFLNTIRAHEHLKGLPKPMEDGAQRAYFGGRIDAAGWGVVGDAYHYDITSAYPAAMTTLPSLADLTWKTTRKPENPFSLCHISWESDDRGGWNPLPYREEDGRICYPPEGEGWYWLVEIEAARRVFGRRLKIKMLEAYTPKGEHPRPLDKPIRDAFKYRAALKREENPAHVPIKLGLNSLYGKTAQRISFGRRPRFRSLAWAGYVTAYTRAMILEALDVNPYVIMTDSVSCADPMPSTRLGNAKLGAWEGGPIRDLAIVESGLYEFEDARFTRGFESDSIGMSVTEMIREFEQGRDEIPFQVTRFVGMKLALMGGEYWDNWRNFMTMERAIKSPYMEGTTKRLGMGIVPRWLREPLGEGFHRAWNRSINVAGRLSGVYRRSMIERDRERDEDRAALECTEEPE